MANSNDKPQEKETGNKDKQVETSSSSAKTNRLELPSDSKELVSGTLKAIDEYINKSLPELNKLTVDDIEIFIKRKDKDEYHYQQAVLKHLSVIKGLLKDSLTEKTINKKTEHPESITVFNPLKITQALAYIESIPTERYRMGYALYYQRVKSDMATAIEKQHSKTEPAITVPKEDRSLLVKNIKDVDPKKIDFIPYKFSEHFIKIHNKLSVNFEKYLRYKENKKLKNAEAKKVIKPAWTYQHQVKDNGEIEAPSFYNDLLQYLNQHNKLGEAYSDFTRAYAVFGTVAKTNEEADNLIDTLVDNASYKPKEKKALKIWLKSKGGQVLDTLEMDFYKNKYLLDNFNSKKDFDLGPDNQNLPKTIEIQLSDRNCPIPFHNWTLNEKGKIIRKSLTYDKAITLIILDKDKFPIQTHLTAKSPIAHNIMEQNTLKQQPPILKHEITWELEIQKIDKSIEEENEVELMKMVKPKVSKWDITSYNKKLSSPEKTYELKIEEVKDEESDLSFSKLS